MKASDKVVLYHWLGRRSTSCCLWMPSMRSRRRQTLRRRWLGWLRLNVVSTTWFVAVFSLPFTLSMAYLPLVVGGCRWPENWPLDAKWGSIRQPADKQQQHSAPLELVACQESTIIIILYWSRREMANYLDRKCSWTGCQLAARVEPVARLDTCRCCLELWTAEQGRAIGRFNQWDR